MAVSELRPPLRVVIESPYAGDIELNVRYARECVRDSLMRGEAPIASHLLHTQPGILQDGMPAEREQGINAGLAWISVADFVAVYADLQISPGMELAIAKADAVKTPVEFRNLIGWVP